MAADPALAWRVAACSMGVSKGTVWYWLLKFGINVRRVALSPGDDVEVVRR